jgi:hypothetical protein
LVAHLAVSLPLLAVVFNPHETRCHRRAARGASGRHAPGEPVNPCNSMELTRVNHERHYRSLDHSRPLAPTRRKHGFPARFRHRPDLS